MNAFLWLLKRLPLFYTIFLASLHGSIDTEIFPKTYEKKRITPTLYLEIQTFQDGTTIRRQSTLDEERRLKILLWDNGKSWDFENLEGVTWRRGLEYHYFSDPERTKLPWPEYLFSYSTFEPPFELKLDQYQRNFCPLGGNIQYAQIFNAQGEWLRDCPGHLQDRSLPPGFEPTSTLVKGWHYLVECFDLLQYQLHYANQLQVLWDDTLRELLGRDFMFFSGFYPEKVNSGVIGVLDPRSDIKITGINGILNSPGECVDWMKEISESHGGVKVHYIYFASEGWTEDFHKCVLAKNGVCFTAAKALAELWRQLLHEMALHSHHPKIIHYAHSLGGAHTEAARNLLTIEEREKIEIVTLGSPLLIHHRESERVINYVDRQDPISLFDPLRYCEGSISKDSNIIFVGQVGPPMISKHQLVNPQYKKVIIEEGKRFKERLAQLNL